MAEPRDDLRADLKTLDFALYRITEQELKIRGLEDDIEALRKEAAERETIRLQREQRWMWWGLLFLGSTITILGKLIWNNLSILLPGRS